MKLLELWSEKVKTKKHPKEGLFASGSDTEIAAWLKKSHEDLKDAMAAPMSEIVKDPPWVRPREPDISIKDSSKEPPKWIVIVSHEGYFCYNLLKRCLKEIFQFPRKEAKVISALLLFPDAVIVLLKDVTRDYAETKAKLANDYLEQEQKGCRCCSSIEFKAIPLPEDL